MLKDILKLFNTTYIFGSNISEQQFPSSENGSRRILTDPPLKLAVGDILVFNNNDDDDGFL